VPESFPVFNPLVFKAFSKTSRLIQEPEQQQKSTEETIP
jgi:hypothetical protein